MLQAASVRVRVNTISTLESSTAVQPIEGPISFPPINSARVITPHFDVLILTLCINNFNGHRVLIHPGSATELLHLPTFRQMGVILSHLSSAGRVLSGFNEATTLIVGDISLLVKVGPVTQQVLFSMVEDLDPYNAIVSRTWLHTMKVVPSTYHQSISYFTPSRQVDLQGSQLAASQCYQLSTSVKKASIARPPKLNSHHSN